MGKREKKQKKEKKGSKGTKVLIAILVILILAAIGLIGYKYVMDNNLFQPKQDGEGVIETGTEKVEVKVPQTFKGNDRPIAVMIDNSELALPQAGLDKAYMVYEFIVEGGETRLMALFKGKNVEKIGPIRSSRHYYLDYALENDAIYVHFGWSPQAQTDISKLGVNNINGIYESEKSFWRATDKNHAYLHSVATSTEKVLEIAKKKGYRTTSDAESVLNYVADEVELDSDILADTVTIPYSDHNTVKYEYNSETKTYQRYTRGKKQVDWVSGESVTVKNIIITFCKNTTLNDGENKGRQTIDNVKTLKGYYITDGKAIEITCEKTSRSGQTVYKDLEGNEINVNDGNTFMQVCPIDAKVKFDPGKIVPDVDANTIAD